MASAYDYPLRPELQITRTTLLSGAFTQGGTTNEHYKTATNSSYRPLSHKGARGDKSVVHKVRQRHTLLCAVSHGGLEPMLATPSFPSTSCV